jgi:CBS domain-containing protein
MTSLEHPSSLSAEDVSDYLRGHELFHGLGLTELDSIAGRVGVEDFAAGVVIVAQDAEPASAIRLVQHGAVDLVDQGRALDRLGEGDLFGHPSMLSGLPTGFEVRAVEDTRCLRLDEADALRVLGRPSGLRYVARFAPGAAGTSGSAARRERRPDRAARR